MSKPNAEFVKAALWLLKQVNLNRQVVQPESDAMYDKFREEEWKSRGLDPSDMEAASSAESAAAARWSEWRNARRRAAAALTSREPQSEEELAKAIEILLENEQP